MGSSTWEGSSAAREGRGALAVVERIGFVQVRGGEEGGHS